jgi:hypothetical protein
MKGQLKETANTATVIESLQFERLARSGELSECWQQDNTFVSFGDASVRS